MIGTCWNNISLTMRIALVLVMTIALSITIFITARDAMAASLKPVSIIDAEVVRLGDLFEGVSRNADYVIGAAPQPGQDMTLNARTLYRIASAMDIAWRPSSSSDQITIRRQAAVVPYETIEETLKSALNDKGVFGRFTVSLNSGKPSLTLPADLPPTVELSTFRYDNQKNYLQATLVSPSVENPVRKMVVTGLVEKIAVVPVLKNTLQNGDIIGRNDIELIEVPEKQLQHNAVLKAENLIGLTPRRIAYGGKFVLANMLERPELVSRGEKVNITFREGPLVLSAKGTALQGGSKDDFIRVKNSASSRMIDALVVGDGQVVVQ